MLQAVGFWGMYSRADKDGDVVINNPFIIMHAITTMALTTLPHLLHIVALLGPPPPPRVLHQPVPSLFTPLHYHRMSSTLMLPDSYATSTPLH